MGRFGAMEAAKRARTGELPSSSLDATRGEETHPTSAFDFDLLDCNICMDPLASPIYQCVRGHILCSECWRQLELCPSCSNQIGHTRCLALEKLIESLSMKCKYAGEGCNRMVKYTEKKYHEKICGYSPVKCPIPLCNFAGARDFIWEHLRAAHSIMTMDIKYGHESEVLLLARHDDYFMLQEKDAFFLLHQELFDSETGTETETWRPGVGIHYYVTHFGRLPAEKDGCLKYELEVRVGIGPLWQTKYTMETMCCSTSSERSVKPKMLMVDPEDDESVPKVLITIGPSKRHISTSVEDGSFSHCPTEQLQHFT